MDCLKEHENELSDACKTYEERIGGKKIEMRQEVRLMIIFRDACKEEMAKFCGNVGRERGGIEKCLSAHENELSAPCKERLNAVREERTKAKTQQVAVSLIERIADGPVTIAEFSLAVFGGRSVDYPVAFLHQLRLLTFGELNNVTAFGCISLPRSETEAFI